MKARIISAIENSRSLSKEMKGKVLKYIVRGQRFNNTEYRNGLVLHLKQPTGMSKISKKIAGCSIGADKNGFFVYTHRGRGKSHKDPLKITKREIDFIESTG
jgi:hypothetical protein